MRTEIKTYADFRALDDGKVHPDTYIRGLEFCEDKNPSDVEILQRLAHTVPLIFQDCTFSMEKMEARNNRYYACKLKNNMNSLVGCIIQHCTFNEHTSERVNISLYYCHTDHCKFVKCNIDGSSNVMDRTTFINTWISHGAIEKISFREESDRDTFTDLILESGGVYVPDSFYNFEMLFPLNIPDITIVENIVQIGCQKMTAQSFIDMKDYLVKEHNITPEALEIYTKALELNALVKAAHDKQYPKKVEEPKKEEEKKEPTDFPPQQWYFTTPLGATITPLTAGQ